MQRILFIHEFRICVTAKRDCAAKTQEAEARQHHCPVSASFIYIAPQRKSGSVFYEDVTLRNRITQNVEGKILSFTKYSGIIDSGFISRQASVLGGGYIKFGSADKKHCYCDVILIYCS